MRAVVIRRHGGFDVLESVDRPAPDLRASEVIVAVRACGLNHLDLWVRKGAPGHTFPLPLIPGSDVAGVVLALGQDAANLKVGDEVVVAPGVSCGSCAACLSGADHRCRQYAILGEHRDGGCAEQIVVPRANVLPKPAGLSFDEAACIGIPFLTAWHMLVDRAQLRHGETVLVHAALSGVGSAAIQIAKLFGATVLATAGTDAKLERARALGVDHAINYTNEDVHRRVKALTDGRGVDVVVEHVGAATWESSLKSLGWHGRLVTCGATTGADVRVDLRHLFFKGISLLGSTMGSKSEFAEVLRHVAVGKLRPVLDCVLPLADIEKAHRRLEDRQAFGRIVVRP